MQQLSGLPVLSTNKLRKERMCESGNNYNNNYDNNNYHHNNDTADRYVAYLLDTSLRELSLWNKMKQNTYRSVNETRGRID